MKIGIVCNSDIRYREILRAIEIGDFVRVIPSQQQANVELVLGDQEHATQDEQRPCVVTKNKDGTIAVECGRHKDMQARVNAGLASCQTLTMVFQDNQKVPESPRAWALPGEGFRRQ